jgi:hypothetical protein
VFFYSKDFHSVLWVATGSLSNYVIQRTLQQCHWHRYCQNRRFQSRASSCFLSHFQNLWIGDLRVVVCWKKIRDRNSRDTMPLKGGSGRFWSGSRCDFLRRPTQITDPKMFPVFINIFSYHVFSWILFKKLAQEAKS